MKTRLLAIASVGGFVLAAAILLGSFWSGGGRTTGGIHDFLMGDFQVRAARAASSPAQSADNARARGLLLAGDYLKTTSIPATVSSAGAPLSQQHLVVRDAVFVGAASTVSSEWYKFSYNTPDPQDVWIVVAEATGLAIPQWNLADTGAVRMILVFEDVSGKLKSASAEAYNPYWQKPQ